jgi:hypothetical protein
MSSKRTDRERTTLAVGTPQTDTTKPAHTPGVRQGNARGNYDRQAGHRADGRSTAERSTGVNPSARNPIDPRMPNLSPA